MNDYKYFLTAVCVIILLCGVLRLGSEYLKSQEKQKELEVKKLELLVKLKNK